MSEYCKQCAEHAERIAILERALEIAVDDLNTIEINHYLEDAIIVTIKDYTEQAREELAEESEDEKD